MAASAVQLDRHPGVWRGGDFASTSHPSLGTGFAVLDAELPGGGWPRGVLTEILPQHIGIGELRLFGPALAQLSAEGKSLAWIAPPHLPYAPALAAAGIALSRLLIVKTTQDKDTLWAAEQALRSAACAAVLVWPGALQFPQLRRLQLAAENGRCLAVLFRPPAAAREATPAALRLSLATHRGGLALTLLKRRGAPLFRPIVLPATLPASAAIYRSGDFHAVDSPLPAATAVGSLPARLALA